MHRSALFTGASRGTADATVYCMSPTCVNGVHVTTRGIIIYIISTLVT